MNGILKYKPLGGGGCVFLCVFFFAFITFEFYEIFSRHVPSYLFYTYVRGLGNFCIYSLLIIQPDLAKRV